LAGELQVNSYVTANQRYPAVGVTGNGSFVVVWQSFDQDDGGNGLFARRFDSAGAAQAAEFQVANSTFQDQRFPTIAMAPSGDFVVAWSWYTGDSSTDSVFARRFDATANSQGEAFQVNTYTTGTQGRPAATINATGDFGGVFAQRLAPLAVLDVDGDGSIAALSDGLLVVRFMFGFTGPTLVSGAVGAGCTRCTAPAIESYLGSLT
jgi:hypothetical protein